MGLDFFIVQLFFKIPTLSAETQLLEQVPAPSSFQLFFKESGSAEGLLVLPFLYNYYTAISYSSQGIYYGSIVKCSKLYKMLREGKGKLDVQKLITYN